MNEPELKEKIELLFSHYQQIKSFVKRADSHLYERWKAGGFLIDYDVVSSYPNLEQVIDELGLFDEDEL